MKCCSSSNRFWFGSACNRRMIPTGYSTFISSNPFSKVNISLPPLKGRKEGRKEGREFRIDSNDNNNNNNNTLHTLLYASSTTANFNRWFAVPGDKILESLVSGTRTKATVTSQYLTDTVQQGKCNQASHQQSQLRLAIHRIAYPVEEM